VWGVGFVVVGPGPTPPTPKPHSPIPNPHCFDKIYKIYYYKLNINLNYKTFKISLFLNLIKNENTIN
jgi:hypothetical protein